MSSNILTAADYDRALELWPTELMRLAKNVAIVPYWIGDTDRFWYRHEDQNGYGFRTVDAPTGKQTPSFDHALVARALNAAPDALPIDRFEYADDGKAIIVTRAGLRTRVDLAKGEASAAGSAVNPSLPGPNGLSLFIRDFNIWVRDAHGGERALTTDGVAHAAWGSPPDADLTKVARNRAALPRHVVGCVWSPSGHTVLAQRLDETKLEPYPYLESVPADGSMRPKVHYVRRHLLGEAETPKQEWAVIDVATGKRTRIADLPGELEIFDADGGAWWSADGTSLYLLAASDDTQHVALVKADVATGAVKILHEERNKTFFHFNTYDYNTPNARLVDARRELLWFSQSDGWGHLYAIDIDKGGIARKLTEGAWAIFDVIAVTDKHVFFTAGGREPGRHPYYRHLYRVDLGGAAPNSGLKLLTPEDADHGFPGEPTPGIARSLGRPQGNSQMSPSARYFLDAISRVDQAPVYLLRNAGGETIAEIARADVSALEATGWKPPEIFTAKAADGKTVLYGVIIKPRAFDAGRKWPVLERIYAGPQVNANPRSFLEGLNGSFTHALNAMAEMGFVIAVLDGPGTPYRSRAFHDMTYGTDDRWGVRHHRAALEGAAKTRPWMDISCVGISGHSYGGYGTAMALLLEPDFYKVGVSTAGMYDPMRSQWDAAGRFIGRPLFEGGRHTKIRPDEQPLNYSQHSPGDLAQNLKGHLLLAYGDLDENIQPAALLAFVDRLVKAGKDYDLLFLPGKNHNYVPDPYFQKKMWDYFIAHVQGREPLMHHRLNVQPGTRLFI